MTVNGTNKNKIRKQSKFKTYKKRLLMFITVYLLVLLAIHKKLEA